MLVMKLSLLAQCFSGALFSLNAVSEAIGKDQHKLQFDSAAISSSPLFSLHRKLMEIDSTSGNENDLGHFLKRFFENRNFTVETQSVEPVDAYGEKIQGAEGHPRFNLLAYPNRTRNTRVLVSSHIDTVPPYWPYEVRKHNEIWGRGSVDAKGCIATQIIAVEELMNSGKIVEGDVSFLFVVGEEIGGDGMRKANDLGLKWETVIFGEPTELKLASGHKGYLGVFVKAIGKAAHSGYPWLGENANSMLVPALYALDRIELPSSEKYGNTTLNIGMIEGGVAGNVIPEAAKAHITLRIAAGSPDDSKNIILDAIKKVDERLEVRFADGPYGPVYIDSDVEGQLRQPRFSHALTDASRFRYHHCQLWDRHPEPER